MTPSEIESIEVGCPYCGESVELLVERDVDGEWVQDCEVCCNPWQVKLIRSSEGQVRLDVDRLDT